MHWLYMSISRESPPPIPIPPMQHIHAGRGGTGEGMICSPPAVSLFSCKALVDRPFLLDPRDSSTSLECSVCALSVAVLAYRCSFALFLPKGISWSPISLSESLIIQCTYVWNTRQCWLGAGNRIKRSGGGQSEGFPHERSIWISI